MLTKGRIFEGRYFVTPHAVRRFIARICPRMEFDEARAAILAGLAAEGGAAVTRSTGRHGQTMVLRVRSGANGGWNFRALIGPGQGDLPAVVTILKSGKPRKKK